MFKKHNDELLSEGGEGELHDTIIAQGVKVEGDFKSRGNIIIEGMVVGSLKTDNSLRVGDKAKIAAAISAKDAFIAGEVQGNVKIKEKLELSPTSRVYGDIEAKVLIINAGAVLNGKCAMLGAEAPVPIKSDKKLKKDEKDEEEPKQ